MSIDPMTSPTQRAGADVQPVACDVVSIDGGIVAQRVSIAYANEMLLALEWEGCSKANFVYSESDYAALQARIAELEARNAASERLMIEMREAALWTEIWGGLLATSVYGHFALTSETSEAVCKQNADRFREAAEKSETVRAAIDAHAQGQAGEEK